MTVEKKEVAMKLTVKGKYQQTLNQTMIKGCEKKR